MGRSRKNRPQKTRGAASVASRQVYGPENQKMADIPIECFMFRPLICNPSSQTIDFEHVQIPFLSKDGLLFTLFFLDGIDRDISIYVKCYDMNEGNILDLYQDGTKYIRECLAIEQLIGVSYYFDKLQKLSENYLSALRLFLDKGILAKERAVELLKDLGIKPDAMKNAGDCSAAGIILSQFLKDILETDGETKEN